MVFTHSELNKIKGFIPKMSFDEMHFLIKALQKELDSRFEKDWIERKKNP